MPTLDWNAKNFELILLDQRALPGEVRYITCQDYTAVAEAIQKMVVRGAPAIGVAAAYGMALAAGRSAQSDLSSLREELNTAASVLQASRPTAVNLFWAVRRILKLADQPVSSPDELKEKLLAEAQRMAAEDVEINRRMAEYGAELIADGDTILHHCNTGALATVGWGTALGVIRMAHEQGKRIHVLVDETRPRLQGARLTAWELSQYGIPYHIISDGAAGYFLHSGQADKVFFGADRVAANGDVANKIGSYMLALAAKDNQVPVYSVFPISTVDLELENGDEIPIEERSQSEVLDIQLRGLRVTPVDAQARNPAFDVTPHRLLTALVTEKGVIRPPFTENLRQAILGKTN